MSKLASSIKNFFKKHSWKNLTGRRKSFIIAGIVVFMALGFWLFNSSVGLLAQTSFQKTFDRSEVKIVTVYDSDGETLRSYKGHIGVERYNGHYSIIDFDTHKRVDIYGQATILIDEPQDE